MSEKKFLELKEWNANHSSVWKEIVSRFGQADYDDESIRTTREETLEAEWDAKQYQRDRASAYPDLAEQFDLLWHAIDGGKFNVKSKETDFYKKLKAVKDANPKPE